MSGHWTLNNYFCYICNKRMSQTIYVCNEHKDDPAMPGAFRFVLQTAYEARRTPDAPLLDLSRFGIYVHLDVDLRVDEGL